MDDGWDFRVSGHRSGRTLVETVHKGLSSMQMEVDVWRTRMERGECDEIRVTDLRRAWIAEYQGGGDQTRTIRAEPPKKRGRR